MKSQRQPRRVQLIHKAIALNAAAGDMKTAQQAWDMAPVRYRGAMSLCMYLGRLKSPVGKTSSATRDEQSENRRATPRGLMSVQQGTVKDSLC